MANKAQVVEIRKGFRSWNRWRQENPDLVPELAGAELSGANMDGANLIGADLTGADLSHAKLRGAQLDHARLSRADLAAADLGVDLEDLAPFFAAFGVPGSAKSLGRASLKGADLREASLLNSRLTSADLRSADLRGANLSFARFDGHSFEPGEALQTIGMTFPPNLAGARLEGAILYKTIFRGAVLRDVNFKGAMFASAEFFDVDLSTSSGLAEAKHFAQTSFDLKTLERTAAGLRRGGGDDVKDFLRAAGVPLQYIESFERRVSEGRFYSCFIAHSAVDAAFCRKLCDRLRAAGVSVWYAPEDSRGGVAIHEQIRWAIQSHQKLLLVLSEESMRSDWVAFEIREAISDERRQNRRKLFPLAITDFENIKKWGLFDADTGQDLAVRAREYFIPDFSRWNDEAAFESAFQRLVADLQSSEVVPGPSREGQAKGESDGMVVEVWG